MNGKIFIRRDRIQFEGMEFPDDGNSYSRQASLAWETAASEAIEAAGYEADVEAGYGRDHTKYCVWIEPTASDEDGEAVELTTEEEAAAKQVGDDADSAGMEAAHDFAREAASADPD